MILIKQTRTHNGLMHVLDAVMVPLEQLNTTASGTPSSNPSSTVTNTAIPTTVSSNAAASFARAMNLEWTLWVLTVSLLALV